MKNLSYRHLPSPTVTYRHLPFYLSLIILFLSFPIFSQNFITEINQSSLILTGDETARLNKYVQSDYTDTTRIVKIEPFIANMPNGTLDFVIPGLLDTFTAKTVKFDYTDDGNFGWIASLENGKGNIILVARDSGIVGSINTGLEYYSLEFLKTGYNVLVKHDLAKYEAHPDGCATENGPVPPPLPEPDNYCDTAYSVCPAIVHILVLLTPEAQAWFLEASNNNTLIATLYVWYSIYTLEYALINSDVPNKDVRFTVEPFTMQLTGNITSDVNSLSQNAQTIRQQHEADFVVMLTNSQYGDAFGVVNCISHKFNCSYGIVVSESMTDPRYTFAHEIGHLFGCRHDRINDDFDSCSHGWGFEDDNEDWHLTLLTTTSATEPGDPSSRILHYSNPDVDIDGFATGTPDDDNAKTIRNTGCFVANHFNSGEMLVGMSGPSNVCNIEWETFYANVVPASTGTPGQPPFSYEWRWNTTGMFTYNNPGTFISNADNITIGNLACPEFYLFLIVNSSDGVTIVRVKKITTKKCDECGVDPPGLATSTEEETETIRMSLSPNPATGEARLYIAPKSGGQMTLAMANAQGKIVYQFVEIIQDGKEHSYELPIEDMAPGFYFCTVQLNGLKATRKLLISK